MIRVFHFAKNNTKYKTDLHFFLDEDNTLLSYLLRNSLDNVLVNSQISFAINEGNRVSKNWVRSKNFCLGFILDKDISRDKNFMKKQFYKGNYLFFKVNSNIERVQNSYKMYNNFDDYKKILFFISFLKQILTNQYSFKGYEVQKKFKLLKLHRRNRAIDVPLKVLKFGNTSWNSVVEFLKNRKRLAYFFRLFRKK